MQGLGAKAERRRPPGTPGRGCEDILINVKEVGVP
jgi:hypothetical protein